MVGDGDELGGLRVLDWTAIVIVAGCVQTIALRLIRIVRAVHAKYDDKKEVTP